jgi:ATP-binding cassette subfamily F protein uup
VTHDRFFLDKIATGLIVFEGDGALRRHAGGYDLYRRLREQREAEAAAASAAVQAKERKADAAPTAKAGVGGARKLSWKEKKELEGMEETILAAEARKEELEARLADPALYTESPDEAARVGDEYRRTVEQVEALYARWAELEEIAASTK